MQYRVPSFLDCQWYHRQDLPGIGPVGSGVGHAWDFRPPGAADAYLGGVAFSGKRVLEIGPASGFWTAEMEQRGASVLALELDGRDWDYVPNAAIDLDAIKAERVGGMTGIRNGWLLARDARGLTADVVYGHAEQPPTDRGRFDISTFGCVLLHTRHPFTVLERCAELTDETILVVDRHWPDLGDAPVMRLAPTLENGYFDTWWEFAPAWFDRALRLLGFREITVTYHDQQFQGQPISLFTVVARR